MDKPLRITADLTPDQCTLLLNVFASACDGMDEPTPGNYVPTQSDELMSVRRAMDTAVANASEPSRLVFLH